MFPDLLLLLIAFLLGRDDLHAQFSNLRFDKYTTANGLSDNNTNAIIQDSRGFLWIGSNNGLSQFDGRFFKKIYPPRGGWPQTDPFDGMSSRG
ncbi:MAG: hypothetical protein IPH88_16800 [Bacteroidales bacterium]|nr:hypothetical protein [Bacteroidales bacterium]